MAELQVHLDAPEAQRTTTIEAVERYFQISLFLLIATGFATLVTTGKLDAFAVVGVTAALLVRGWLLWRHQSVRIPERWTTYATIAYVPIYIADFLFLTASFVSATVHMVLFIMVAKIFSVQRDRDYIYLAALAFMEVLSAAILTVDSVFLAAFCIFMALAIATFITMEIRRSAAAAKHSARMPVASAMSASLPTSRRSARLSGRLRQFHGAVSATSMAMMLFIFAATSVIFFLLPRVSAGYLGSFAPRNELVSGFTNEVNLGQIGVIQQSNTVVMHVTVLDGKADLMQIKWRGVALEQFDGQKWTSRGTRSYAAPRRPDGSFDFSRIMTALRQSDNEDNSTVQATWQPLRYRVLMEPVGLTMFFVAREPITMVGNYRWVVVDHNESIYDNDRDRQITAYEVLSNVGEPKAEQVRRSRVVAKPLADERYLQLPPLDPRVKQLAEQVSEPARTSYDKARAIERYLATNFGYTLELPSERNPDPVAYFLFTRKQGHCEYFASAMAVMLRSIGIPSRMVNGFRTGEYNDVTGSYIVRARDAHSWVEAYFPGAGWVSFDPTPAAVRPVANTWQRMALYVDAMREFWREWVVNYDFSHQRTLGTNATSRARRFIDESRLWMRRKYEDVLEKAERTRQEAMRDPKKLGGWTIAALLVMAMLLLIRPAVALWKRQRVMNRPGSAPRAAAGLWYERMTRVLAHRGWRKKPVQSPREFVETIDDAKLRNDVEAFTSIYERARFGGSSEDAEKLPEKYRELVGKN